MRRLRTVVVMSIEDLTKSQTVAQKVEKPVTGIMETGHSDAIAA